MRRGRGTGGFSPAVVAVVLAVAGCGTETYVYLSPIDTDTINFDSPAHVYSFKHNTDNDIEEFLGYDLYYRIFEAGDPRITSVRRAIEGEFISSSSQLTRSGRDFRRLIRTGVGEIPFVEVGSGDRGDPLDLYFDFSYLLSVPPEYDVPRVLMKTPTSAVLLDVEASRYDSGTGLVKSFRKTDFELDDSDMRLAAAGWGSLTGRTLVVLVCVIAYGLDRDEFTPLYSEAVFLYDSAQGGGTFVISFS